MLRFFGQIRQRLLTVNRFSKYLLYAVGEILLVVIGILIALQVDNWNEERQIVRAQKEVLIKLRQDLEYDLKLFSELDSTYIIWTQQAINNLEGLRTNSTDQLNSIHEYIVGKGSFYYITIRDVSFEEMKNTGLFYKLKDPVLSQAIIDYYEFAKFEVEKLNMDNHDLYSFYLNAMNLETASSLRRLSDKRNMEYIDWDWLKDPDSNQYKEFEYHISMFIIALYENRRVLGQTIDKVNKAIQEIPSD